MAEPKRKALVLAHADLWRVQNLNIIVPKLIEMGLEPVIICSTSSDKKIESSRVPELSQARQLKDDYFPKQFMPFINGQNAIGRMMTPEQLAKEYGLEAPVYVPSYAPGGTEIQNIAERTDPAIIISADSYATVLPETIRRWPTVGAHPGPLPEAPNLHGTAQQIICGDMKRDDKLKGSVHLLGEEIGKGAVVKEVEIPYDPDKSLLVTRRDLYEKLMRTMMDDIVPAILKDGKDALKKIEKPGAAVLPELTSERIKAWEKAGGRIIDETEYLKMLDQFAPAHMEFSAPDFPLPTGFTPTDMSDFEDDKRDVDRSQLKKDYNDILNIELRKHMKRQFFTALRHLDDSPLEKYPGSFVSVIGSTTLFLAEEAGKTRFPIRHFETEDVDLNVNLPANVQLSYDRVDAITSNLIGKTIEQAGFGHVSVRKGPINYENIHVAMRDFSPSEMRKILGSDTDIKIPSHPVRVHLEVQAVPHNMFTNFLPLEEGHFNNGHAPIFVCSQLDMLSTAIARSMVAKSFRQWTSLDGNNFKLSDLVNNYIATESFPPVVDLANEEIRRTLRLLTIIKLAEMNKTHEDFTLSTFDPTAEHIAQFNESAGKDGLALGRELSDQLIDEVLVSFKHTITTLFPDASPSTGLGNFNPLGLSQNEVDYIQTLQGYKRENKVTSVIRGENRVDLLKNDYADIFSKYPQLEETIKNAHDLKTMSCRTYVGGL